MERVRSVSGLRGVWGQGLDPSVVRAHAVAFARSLGSGPIVVGRDARPSGPLVLQALAAALSGIGREVVDLGLCATPAVQVAVEDEKAAGGIVITASHNPAPWNGLKFVGDDGTFLGPGRARALFQAADRFSEPEGQKQTPTIRHDPDAVRRHAERALASPEVEVDRIPRAKLSAVVDGCRSVGGLSTVLALRRAGCEVTELDCEPDGRFTRGLEPLPENLGALGRRVVEVGAHFGVAHDPDGDRAALVDETGTPLGEELTLAIAIGVVLSRRVGPVVVNLSTSRVSQEAAERFGAPFHRAAVGEINVVEAMRAHGAVVGGEGNGGVILPSAHYGRDGTVAALLVARCLAEGPGPLSAIAKGLGRYAMVKEKVEGVDWESARPALAAEFAGAQVDDTDGLRFDWPGEWLHVRPSGTEPMVRVIAEAPEVERARARADRARRILGGFPMPRATRIGDNR